MNQGEMDIKVPEGTVIELNGELLARDGAGSGVEIDLGDAEVVLPRPKVSVDTDLCRLRQRIR